MISLFLEDNLNKLLKIWVESRLDVAPPRRGTIVLRPMSIGTHVSAELGRAPLRALAPPICTGWNNAAIQQKTQCEVDPEGI